MLGDNSFIYLKGGRERWRETERDMEKEGEESFPVLVHYPNALDTWGWASLNLRAQSPILVSQVGGQDPVTWSITCCFLGAHKDGGGYRHAVWCLHCNSKCLPSNCIVDFDTLSVGSCCA